MLNTEEKYGGDVHTKSYPKRKLLPKFDDEAIEPIQLKTADQRTNHPVAVTGRLMMPHTSQHMIYVSSWTKSPVWPGPSMDLGSALRHRIRATKAITLIEYQQGISTEHNNR